MSKIGFFAAEGVPPEAAGYIMLIIQFFPMFVAFYIVSMAMREIHADKARRAKEALKAKRSKLGAQGLGSMKNLSLSPKAPKESSRSRLSGLSPMKGRKFGSKKKDMASSEDAAALAGEESAPPEQTITVKMMRTPLGLGLTVDSQNKVVKIAADSQAQRSGGFAVGQRLISLNGQALSTGVSFDKQLSTIAVGTPVIIEVSMPADRV
jgi:hypothetical protein